MLDKSFVRVMAVLAVLILASSGAAFAHFAQGQKVVESKTVTQPKVEATASNDSPTETPAPSSIKSEPCTKTVTENSDTDGSDVTNVKKTMVHCQSSSQGSSSSVNITSENNQSATTGDSDGESGSASNSDTTDIQVN